MIHFKKANLKKQPHILELQPQTLLRHVDSESLGFKLRREPIAQSHAPQKAQITSTPILQPNQLLRNVISRQKHTFPNEIAINSGDPAYLALG